MSQRLIKVIEFYQKTSKALTLYCIPGMTFFGCKYYPTCSEYAISSIKKFGPARGSLKGAYRLLRCNPLSKGGVDIP